MAGIYTPDFLKQQDDSLDELDLEQQDDSLDEEDLEQQDDSMHEEDLEQQDDKLNENNPSLANHSATKRRIKSELD